VALGGYARLAVASKQAWRVAIASHCQLANKTVLWHVIM
jgi:hypothetical protein